MYLHIRVHCYTYVFDILLVWVQNCFAIPTADIYVEKSSERRNVNKDREGMEEI